MFGRLLSIFFRRLRLINFGYAYNLDNQYLYSLFSINYLRLHNFRQLFFKVSFYVVKFKFQNISIQSPPILNNIRIRIQVNGQV